MARSGQSFLRGAAILMAATLVVKAAGVLFKIPLASLLGGEGMGYFMTAYTIFNPIYALSVAGFPTAVAKMVSAALAAHRPWEAGRILRVALALFCSVGLLLSLLLWLVAPALAVWVNNPPAARAVQAIAPAVVLGCFTAAFRGYYEGHSNMVPTAASQVVEAAIKLVAGVLLAGWAVAHAPEGAGQSARLALGAAGAISGVVLGSAGAGVFMLLYHLADVLRHPAHAPTPAACEPVGRTGGRLLALAFPVCMSALVVNLTSLIDLGSIMNRLSAAAARAPQAVLESYPGAQLPLQGLPNFLYGSYTTLALTVYNLVPAVAVTFGMSALPIVTRLWVSGQRRRLEESIASVLRLTALLVLPAGLGVSALSEPILLLLFAHNPQEIQVAAPLLRVLGVAAIFGALVVPVHSMLQAVGRIYLPARLMLMGGLVKLGINYLLVGIPSVNIQGAPWGTLACYVLILFLGLNALVRQTGICLSIPNLLGKPLFCALLCALSAHSCYGFLHRWWESPLAVLPAIAAGAGVYGLALLLTRALAKEDLQALGRGEKLVKILEKYRLLG